MHFSKIYIQENFVPNVVQDPFGRKVIGTEVFLDKDDDIEKGRELAEQYIIEYIQKNTVYPDHNHVEERYLQPEKIPDIQVENKWLNSIESNKEEILGCNDLKELESWKMISQSHPVLAKAYKQKLKQLQP